ncbi:Endonuclease III [Moraxella caviae]|uniref:Endonuclease III n=2 Tax=Moraxella caviae TaxID=34060 RepID=A0A378RBW0_9GAMM|nr:Endonuclease III [Moraxella caviae]VEW13134.1 Endonuclease III [Moraxella caviae]VEW13177.1 Endonuclease III [Moraxella caviae]
MKSKAIAQAKALDDANDTKSAKAVKKRAPKVAKTADTPPSRKMSREKVQHFFEKLAATIDEPVTELQYSTTFELLIAVMLSAQSTDKGVNIATAKLFPVANTPQAILDLGLDGLKSYINTIGLYNSKAANVMKTCADLIAKHGGEVPRTRSELEALAGVGRKTANVVLNTAFGEPVMAVDTHIFRVGNRTGLATGKNVREVEDKLMKAIPKEFLVDAHHYLILHGRYTCMARSPKCGKCPVYDECMFKDKAKWVDV